MQSLKWVVVETLFGLGGGAFLCTAVLNHCVNQGQGCVPRFSYPLRNTDTLLGKSSPLLAACSAVVSYTPCCISSNWQWLIQICLMGKNGCLCSKTIRRNKLLVSQSHTLHGLCKPTTSWSIFVRGDTISVLFCFLIQRNISKQSEAQRKMSAFFQKNCLVSDFWISSWGHGEAVITASCCPGQGDKDIYHQRLKWACQSPEVERSPHRKGPLRHRAGGGGLDIHPLNKGQCICKASIFPTVLLITELS